MQNLIPLIFTAIFVYLLFSRKGGMGCCGGHGEQEPERYKDVDSKRSSHNAPGNVIDLHEGEYSVIELKDKKPPKFK